MCSEIQLYRILMDSMSAFMLGKKTKKEKRKGGKRKKRKWSGLGERIENEITCVCRPVKISGLEEREKGPWAACLEEWKTYKQDIYTKDPTQEGRAKP